MVAAAMIGSAVIGAVGSAASAKAQSSAAKKAAQAGVDAAAGTNALDLSIYRDQRDLLEPGIMAGAEARARQMLMQGYSPESVRAYLEQTQRAVNSPGPVLDDGAGTPLSRYMASRGISGGTGGAVGRMVTSPASGRPGQPETGYGDVSLTNLGSYQGGAAEQAYRNANAETPFSGGELAQMDAEEAAAAAANAPPTQNFDWVDDWEWAPNSPSYQFRFDQGAEALNRNLAARGLYQSGAAAKRLTEYGQDLASTEFEADFGRLGELAGEGRANTGQAINISTNLGANMGANNRYAADARASGYINSGNAAAAGYRGAANSAIGAINAYGAYNGWWPNNGGWS